MRSGQECDEDSARLRPARQRRSAWRSRRVVRRFFLCHATPSDPLFAYCPPDSPNWVPEGESVDADLILVGHTHLPFVKTIGTRTIVNPGSLGQPKHGGPSGSYVVWQDDEVSLRTVPYPVERTVDRLKQLPLAARVINDLVHLLRTGSPSAA